MPTLVQDLLRIGELDRVYDRKRLQTSFDEAALAQVNERCIHELFELEAEQTPDALALTFRNQRLTYRQLNEKANQLAHFLIRFGVGPNSLVGLCVHRTPELLIGILGILKAGGAYVPMDPSWSRDRLQQAISDSNIFVLLTQSALLERLPRHDGPRLSLDGNKEIIAKERTSNPSPRATPRNLAYTIYSSGSFGEARGVRISHRGLLNYLSWGVEAFQVARGVQPAVDASIPLDLAITRMLSLLMFGRSISLNSGGPHEREALYAV